MVKNYRCYKRYRHYYTQATYEDLPDEFKFLIKCGILTLEDALGDGMCFDVRVTLLNRKKYRGNINNERNRI